MWIALFVNAGMFLVELAGGWNAGSVSLLADAIDFFGDAANYGLSLFVPAPVWRSRTALIKGITMGSYGVFVLGTAAWNVAAGVLPEPATMGVIGFLAAARKQGKYWQALEALLASQSNWTQHHTARVDLVWSQLEGLGLDIDRMRSDMQSPEIDRLIQQDLADSTRPG